MFAIECLQTKKKKKGIQSNGKLFKAHVYTVYTCAWTHTRMYTKAEKCFNLATLVVNLSYLARIGRVDVGGGGEKCSRQKEKLYQRSMH